MDYTKIYEAVHLKESDPLVDMALKKYPNNPNAQLKFLTDSGVAQDVALRKLSGRAAQTYTAGAAKAKAQYTNAAQTAPVETVQPNTETPVASASTEAVNVTQPVAETSVQGTSAETIAPAETTQAVPAQTEPVVAEQTTTPEQTVAQAQPTEQAAPTDPVEAEEDKVKAEVDAESAKIESQLANSEDVDPKTKDEVAKASEDIKKAQADLEALVKKFKADSRIQNMRVEYKQSKSVGKVFEKNYQTVVKSIGRLNIWGKIAIAVAVVALVGVSGSLLTGLLKSCQKSSKLFAGNDNSSESPEVDNTKVNTQIVGSNTVQLTNKAPTVQNSIEAQANAKPGDVIQRKDGSKYTLTQGDINWAKKQLAKAPQVAKQPVEAVPTNPIVADEEKVSNTPVVDANVANTPEVASAPTENAPVTNVSGNIDTPLVEPQVQDMPVEQPTTNTAPVTNVGGNDIPVANVNDGSQDAGFQRWKKQNAKNYNSMVAQAQASGKNPEEAAYAMYKQALASNDVNAFRSAQNAQGMVDASGSGRTDKKAMKTMNQANLQAYNAQQLDNLVQTDPTLAQYIEFYKQKNPKMANASNEEIINKAALRSGLYKTVNEDGQTRQVLPPENKPMYDALQRARKVLKNKTVAQ